MKVIIYAALAAAFITAMGLIGNMEQADAQAEQALYCEMIETYQQTGGQYGWPPYKGECEVTQ